MSTWPSTLPAPLMSGYGIAQQTQVVRTEMETGTSRTRRRSSVRFDHIEAGVLLSASQLALLREWFDASGSSTHAGTAQAGGASTVTLASAASATDDTYNSSTVTITAGTGAGQTRIVTDYVGATRVATVDAAWTTQPDSTSVYDVSGGAQGGAGWFTVTLDGGGASVSCEARFLEPWRAEKLSFTHWRVSTTLEVRYA